MPSQYKGPTTCPPQLIKPQYSTPPSLSTVQPHVSRSVKDTCRAKNHGLSIPKPLSYKNGEYTLAYFDRLHKIVALHRFIDGISDSKNALSGDGEVRNHPTIISQSNSFSRH